MVKKRGNQRKARSRQPTTKKREVMETNNLVHLGDLLERFSKYKKDSLPERISKVFEKFGIAVNPKNISIKNRQVFVECSGAVKTELLIKKQKIMEDLLKNKDIPEGGDIK